MRAWIKAALLALCLNANAAESVLPTPGRQGKADQLIQKTNPKAQHQSTPDKQGSKENPLFVNVVPSSDAEKRAAEEREDRKQASTIEDRLGRYTLWLVITTAGLVIATAVLGAVAIWQGRLLRGQIQLAREEFISTHRPRLRVSNFDTHSPGDIRQGREPFKQNETVAGQFYITNVGGTTAIVTAIGCWVNWWTGSLPRVRPYEGKDPNTRIQSSLAPGQSMPILFNSEEPLPQDIGSIRQRSSGWGLYVLGWIEYRDVMGYRRRTEFCREWRPETQRYAPVNDNDYEYEE
jgi:hypothetical protein